MYDSLEVGAEGKEGGSRCSATEQWIKPGDQIWRNRRRGEGLHLAYLLPWLEWPMSSQEVLAGVGD